MLARSRELGARKVDRQRDQEQREHHEREREPDRELDRRQNEDVVADVTPEDRIDLAEGRPVDRLQHGVPLRGDRQRSEEREERRPW